MEEKNIKIIVCLIFIMVVVVLVGEIFAETLYVDSQNGNDTNPGTIEKPLLTIGKASNNVKFA